MEDILISKVGGYSFFFYLKLQSLSCHGFFHVNLAVWFSSVTQLIPAFLVLDKSTGCVAVNMESSYVIQRLIKGIVEKLPERLTASVQEDAAWWSADGDDGDT